MMIGADTFEDVLSKPSGCRPTSIACVEAAPGDKYLPVRAASHGIVAPVGKPIVADVHAYTIVRLFRGPLAPLTGRGRRSSGGSKLMLTKSGKCAVTTGIMFTIGSRTCSLAALAYRLASYDLGFSPGCAVL